MKIGFKQHLNKYKVKYTMPLFINKFVEYYLYLK